ncbi:MAG: 3-oxoacyl-[acyl-carrier-protein] reductase [Oscillospiraceae bacterium]|nr:3-oxoacyl-[acyl-carrier-protein] reductase [Oscillospiraceae bacterium]MDE6005909.1 3-oxoacyl-[acyl-carrier-protein] reductase [Oscillospiraceae bacterium]MDE6657671.1 3-oxoacyl-[acyl-carrier-protein] reductase [Oscillospiraceae bacterium]
MLKDKIAVVTGGSQGIGFEICKKFAENGAKIAIIDINSAEKMQTAQQELEKFGTEVQLYSCNVADSTQVADTCKQILKNFGRVDILVNNAGITRDNLILRMSETDFDAVIDVNLKGAFYMIKNFYRPMIKQKSGKIINISSVSGLFGNAGQANYSASKAGIIGLTKSTAKELAGRGICCNAIAPGFIATSMTTSFQDNAELIKSIPAGRFGKPEEVAGLALFLASPQSDYITGEVIRIDGGMAM